MATVDKWRTCLNESSFCKKLRENNARESDLNEYPESKGLVAVNDNDVFIWDEQASHLIFYNLKNILSETKERLNRHQVLRCTDSPRYVVEWLEWNLARTHLALWGQLGITVIELPQKWGKFAEFQGGRDAVSCKSMNVAEHYFSGHKGIKLLMVRWHPASATDTHLVFLTSDNILSIYTYGEPEVALQKIYLTDSEPSFGMSLSRPTISSALGDSIVAFDFGSPIELKKKGKADRQQESKLVWPVYCVRGNGDVVVAYTDISTRPVKLPVQGPLLMHPPAEDNYGTDACAILCLQTTPTVVVITTNEGRLHHCLLLPRDPEETTLLSESSFRSTTEEACDYHVPDEVLLYVYETVELELALATPQFHDSPAPEEIFTCPIHMTKDVYSHERYHCMHAAGIHTVALPWIHTYQAFGSEEEEEEESVMPDLQESVVEHLICTRPVTNSPAAPVLGLGVVRDSLVGSVMLTLSSDYEFQCLRLSDMRHNTGMSTLLSSSKSQAIPSPLRKISREPFDERIRRILQRSSSNPLIKSRQNTQLGQQECFQLLSRTTQVFREEYIQKQDLARQEIKRRVSILQDQKGQQVEDLTHLYETRSQLTQGAQYLANLCEECKENQEDSMKRIEAIMRKLQARVPFLSESERRMKQELENMEEKLETYKRGLEQLRVKREYQQRQIQQSRKTNQPSPVIKSNQMTQLRDVLKQEGDELAEVMKTINKLKLDTSV